CRLGRDRTEVQLGNESMEKNNYTKYRTYANLYELAKVHDASSFGRVNQALLSIAFQKAGFIVSHYQGTGRPDFIAGRNRESYAIEVKAPVSEKVSLSRDDIAGVEKLGHKPILAILAFPSPESRWLFIETNKLLPKVYQKNEIERFSMINLENEILPHFLSAIEENKEKAMIGASALQSMVESRI
ncbi:MAG: hypothetical protein ACRD38_12530, partial [Nitrososphaerales archaeon]